MDGDGDDCKEQLSRHIVKKRTPDMEMFKKIMLLS